MRKMLLIASVIMLSVLVFSVAQSFLLPVDASAKANTTPGAKATEKAIEKANPSAEEDQNGAAKQNFKGAIDSVSEDGKSFVLKLANDTSVTILLMDTSKVKFPGNGKKTNGATTLQAGMTVIVQATLNAENQLVARQVHLIPGKPTQLHRVGKVIELTDTSITVQGSDGETTKFTRTADTKILPKDRQDLLKVDATVTIICPRTFVGEPVAKGIVVHPDGSGQENQDQEQPETNG
jgi:hypothetical protein